VSNPEPLDDELARLFRSATHPRPPAGARARVRDRLAVATAGSAAAATAKAAAGAGKKALASLTMAFAGGALVGGTIVAMVRPRDEHVVYVASATSAAVPSSASAAPAPLPREDLGAAAAPPHSSASSIVHPRHEAGAARGPHASSMTLAAERAVLDDARRRIAAGDGPAALAVLAEHERRFPHPQLAEEREALAIQALANAGRYAEARARADRFRRSVPGSVYLDTIDITLRSIP